MLLFEEHAALLLTAHAIFALLTVALSTHLVIWLRHGLRGNFGNQRAVVRFAGLSASAYGITMLLGMALYPTYKVRVRAEFLENPSRIRKSAELEVLARKQVRAAEQRSRRYRLGRQGSSQGDEGVESAGTIESEEIASLARDSSESEEIARLAGNKIRRGEKLARWFDVKEHWALLGILLALALYGILHARASDQETKALGKPVFAMAIAAAAIAWSAAIIGLATAAAHSVVAL